MSDIYGDQTVLLLHCEGANASTDFKDSAYRNIVTANGDAKISTAQKKFGASSAYFDGAGDYLSLPDSENWNFGSGDFTIECCFRLNTLPVHGTGTTSIQMLFSQRESDNLRLFLGVADFTGVTDGVAFWFQVDNTPGNYISLLPSAPLATATWYHVAVTRTGASVKLFLDGVLIGSTTSALAVGNYTAPVMIGHGWLSTFYFNGNIDELRVTKGVARYTADFTPPTTAFDDPTIQRADDLPLYWDQTKLLLHMDGPNGATYFRDERHHIPTRYGDVQISTAHSKFGGSSAYFDGTGDGLVFPPISDFNMGTLDFTAECWVKFTAVAAEQWVVAISAGVGFAPFVIGVTSGGVWMGRVAASGSYYNAAIVGGNKTAVVGVWYHVALVRYGTAVLFFVDGVLLGTITVSASLNAGTEMSIGSRGDQFNCTNGYVDSVRVTRGIARYVTRFLPPTKAFPNLQQTDQYWNNVVLAIPGTGTPGSPADIIDLKGHAITFTGDTKISAAKSKFNGASIYFDGTGDYFTVAAHTDFSFGTGDFTIEMFAYFNADSYGSIFRLGTNLIVLEKTGTVGAFSYSLSGSGNSIGSSTPIGTWHHIAAVRISGVFYLYINGVQKSVYSFPTNLAANQQIQFGADNVGTGSLLNGYLQGIRVTKGAGRYTGAFTPPTEPFPTAVPQGLSGVVHDSSGNPIQRTARSYRRDTGQLIGTAVSDPITGLFSLPADNTDEHFVVVFDDTKNALVYDHIVPVI